MAGTFTENVASSWIESRRRRFPVVDVQDAAVLGFIGLCNRADCNSQSDSCHELRYHEFRQRPRTFSADRRP